MFVSLITCVVIRERVVTLSSAVTSVVECVMLSDMENVITDIMDRNILSPFWSRSNRGDNHSRGKKQY